MKWDQVKLDAAIQGRTAVRPVDFPGAPHIQVGVRMLTDSELDACKRRAHDLAKKCDALDVLDFYARALDREIIAQAFVDMDTVGVGDRQPEPFFADQRFVAELDAGVVTQLATLYGEHCKDSDPLVFLDVDGAKELVKRLGKGLSSQVLLSGFDQETLVNLCTILASDLPETSPTPS